MANANVTISALTPVLYSAAQEVSNEPFGAVDGINMIFDDKGVAKGDKVKVPVAPVQTGADFTPNNITPEGVAQTASAVEVEITKSRKTAPMALTGEQIRSLENGGNFQEWVRQWAEQSMRTLRNEAERDACGALKLGASRAFGTAGQTPFATSLAELTAVRKILRDNGAPMADLQFIMNTDAELNLLNLGIIQQAYAAGSDAERRQGRFGRQFGFRLEASAGIASHTSGAAASYVTNGTQSVGATGVVVATGTDAILAGDVFGMATDTVNKYVVNEALTGAGTLKINRPGVRKQVATAQALTFAANYTPSFAFERNAVVGIMRPPLIPDNATIRTQVISDRFGLSYLFVEIQQYGQISWEMHLAWGFKVVQPEHVALLLG